MPTKEDLLDAIKVFAPWMEELVRQQEQDVTRSYVPGQTNHEKHAYELGMARGMEAVIPLLLARIDELE